MGLDEDISTAIEAQLVTDSISALVYNNQDKPTQIPYINVTTDGSGIRKIKDLSGKFYRKEFPFNIEMIGMDDDDADALESSVEKAIVGIAVSSGWFEFESGTKLAIVKKFQKWVVGKKVLYEDVSA